MSGDETFGQGLAARLRDELNDVVTSPDLLKTVHRRNARRAWRIRAAVVPPLAAVAVIGVVLTVGATGGHPGAVRPGATSATVGATATPSSGLRPAVIPLDTVRQRALAALPKLRDFVIVDERDGYDGHVRRWADPETDKIYSEMYARSMARDPYAKPQPVALDNPYRPIRVGLSTRTGSSYHYVQVDYAARTWSEDTLPLYWPDAFEPDPTSIENMRYFYSLKGLRLLGMETVDGVDTFRLQLTTERRYDIWLDAGTYLPVRSRTNRGTGPGVFEPKYDVLGYLIFLPRTAKSLSYFTLTPPPGFTKVG